MFTNEKVVDNRIADEVMAGRLHGPLPPHLKPLAHIRPRGLVPKPHQVNKFQLIMDLSHPNGGSVNDGISPSLCSLRYSSVDEAVDIIRHLGRDTQLVKLDIKDAYRLIPVHPDDYHLLGISWRGETYIDRALPFGLRSAPKIFSAVADFVAWVLHQHGIKHQLHYLDDFLFLEAPNSKETAQILPLILEIFRVLGIPIAAHKTEGPASILVFLGILIDTHRFELRLPAEKLAHLQSVLRQWTEKKSCTRRDLGTLLGHLSHAATVSSKAVHSCCSCFHCCPWIGHLITYSPQCRCTSRHAMVEYIPARLEWYLLFPNFHPLYGSDIRCVEILRLWCILPLTWVVQLEWPES